MSVRFNCGRCPICSPKIFRFWYGENIKRRSHEEAALAKRKKREAIIFRRELNARKKLEKEARRMAKVGA